MPTFSNWRTETVGTAHPTRLRRKMNVEKYFKSISLELTALKDRVRDFINDAHWLTDGEWKEGVLRSVIARNLPSDIQIGRGFILTPLGASTQIDILLYSSASPVIFRDGDLVFIQPAAVKGIIEVKTRLNQQNLKEAVKKIKKIGDMLPEENNAFLAIFSYDVDIPDNQSVLKLLQEETNSKRQIVHLLCLGDSQFIRYWETSPELTMNSTHDKWHSYRLDKMAYGYFIHNVLLGLSPKYIDNHQALWFPETSKEIHKDGEILRQRGPGEHHRIDDLF